MLARVLVANRGEIALRVMRTLRRLGIESVAVYSDADATAPHVRAADRAVRLGPAAAAESYLSIERVIEAAVATGADAIHPGYGFLSERPDFARACADAGITFVGPSAEAMALLGDKVAAKAVARAAGVPVVPGLAEGAGGGALTDDEIVAWAAGGGDGARAGADVAGMGGTDATHGSGAGGAPSSGAGGASSSGAGGASSSGAGGASSSGAGHPSVASREGARLPLLLKAAAGGGGKGMRVVHSLDALPDAIAAARREAQAAFGDDRLLVERFIEHARHIEVQILADAHGNVVHVGERECSLQRRHQKVVEEAPSPVVDEALRARMGEAASALARAAGYVGAGTVELICSRDDPSDFAFLEVNARLQVEHPVTEAVTGLDLVEMQLRVAAGEPLPLTQDEVRLAGHAIEARVYAEDPANGFLPSTGRVVAYREPAAGGGPSVRVDSGVEAGSVVGSHYDPLLAKVIAHGPDRAAALVGLERALGELRVVGPTTNAPWLRALLARPEVRAGELDTGLIERLGEAVAAPAPADELAGVAVAALVGAPVSDDPWDARDGWRLGGVRAPARMRLAGPAGDVDALAVPDGEGGWHVGSGSVRALDADGGAARDTWHIGGGPARARDVVGVATGGTWSGGASGAAGPSGRGGPVRAWLVRREGGVARVVEAYPDGGAVWLVDDGVPSRWAPVVDRAGGRAGAGSLEAPMPGTVIDVRVAPGDSVAEGDTLVIVESMKMELAIQAPADGLVADVLVAAGERVAQSQPLVSLDAGGGHDAGVRGRGPDGDTTPHASVGRPA